MYPGRLLRRILRRLPPHGVAAPRPTDGTRVGLNRPSNPNHVPLPGNFYSLTIGPNWTPTGNLLMRPAFRWDFFGGPYGGPRAPYNDGISNQQTMLGVDMIQKF